MTKQVRASSVFGGANLKEIYFGIDGDFFISGDKKEARKELALPMDAKIIFFGASNINEKRKGYEYLFDALKRLENIFFESDILIVSAGNLKSDLLELKFSQKHFGRVDYTMLRKLYAAADVVVIPSVEDSGPLMTSEVLMTGTIVALMVFIRVDQQRIWISCDDR